MLSRVLLPAVLLVSVLGTGSHLQSAAGGEKGGPEAIEPGKKVKVTRGPAPVKVGKQTLTTVDAGAELMARKVQGNWVQVTVVRDGRSITGWIHRSRLTPSHALSRAGGQAPKERVVDLGGGVKMTLVLIPPGTFTMGSTEAEIKAVLAKRPLSKEGFFADQKPAHKVTISKAFWMGKHEVTVGQFRRFVVATAYKTDAEKGTPGKGAAVANHDGKVRVAQEASWRNPYFKQTDQHPVVCVSWNDSKAFADWLNTTDKAKPTRSSYRLPTEAEWEYACRAGTTTWYQWGDDPNKGKGWCNAADLTVSKAFRRSGLFDWDDGFLYTAPVGSFKANAFGLHDMQGNAYEWCQDWRGPYKEGGQADPTGPPFGTLRLLRGGSWLDAARTLRCASRLGFEPEGRLNYIGFRLALAPGPR